MQPIWCMFAARCPNSDGECRAEPRSPLSHWQLCAQARNPPQDGVVRLTNHRCDLRAIPHHKTEVRPFPVADGHGFQKQSVEPRTSTSTDIAKKMIWTPSGRECAGSVFATCDVLGMSLEVETLTTGVETYAKHEKRMKHKRLHPRQPLRRRTRQQTRAQGHTEMGLEIRPSTKSSQAWRPQKHTIKTKS